MKEIIFGTTNNQKVEQLRSALKPIEVSVKGVDRKLNIEEDGQSALENARKKALSYAADIEAPVLSLDNSLFIEGLPEEEQPCVHVRRINGQDRATDQEMVDYYSQLVASYGGSLLGHWEYAFVLARPDGSLKELVINSPDRLFVDQVCSRMIEGYPLEAVQIDPISGKYFAEMDEDEQELFWQKEIGGPVCQFIRSSLDWLEN